MGRPPCLTALLPKLYQLVIPPLDPSKSLPKKAEPWENPKIPHHAGWRPPSKFSIPVWRLPCLQVSDLPGMTYVRSAHTCPQRCPSLLTNPKPHIHVLVSKRRLLIGISSYVFHLTLSPRIENTKMPQYLAENGYLHHAGITQHVIIQPSLGTEKDRSY